MFSKEKSIFPSIDFFEAKNMLDFRGFSEIDGSIDFLGSQLSFFLGEGYVKGFFTWGNFTSNKPH